MNTNAHTRKSTNQQVSHLEGKQYDPDSNLIKAYSNEVRRGV